MPYIYATALPDNIVKLGRTDRRKERALDGQTYHVVQLVPLALWRVHNGRSAEQAAHDACARWHVRGELYRVPTDWLDTEHPMVTALRAVLGDPLPASELPEPPKRGRRLPAWVHENRKAYRLARGLKPYRT